MDRTQPSVTGTGTSTDLLNLTQAARVVGVSRDIIRSWIVRGDLPATRLGLQRRVAPAELAATYARLTLDGVVPSWRQDRQRCGQRLRRLREVAGLSQLDLAAISGFSHEAISRWETGHKAPNADTVRTLAQTLHVGPETFVSYEPIGLTELSVREVAQHLGIPPQRAERWIRLGVLPGRKVSGQWRVPAVAVRALGGSGRLRGQSLRLDPRYRG